MMNPSPIAFKICYRWLCSPSRLSGNWERLGADRGQFPQLLAPNLPFFINFTFFIKHPSLRFAILTRPPLLNQQALPFLPPASFSIQRLPLLPFPNCTLLPVPSGPHLYFIMSLNINYMLNRFYVLNLISESLLRSANYWGNYLGPNGYGHLISSLEIDNGFETYLQQMAFKLTHLLLSLLALSAAFDLTSLFADPNAHGADLVTTASFYNDDSRFVTGGNDNNVYIWSMADYTLITTLPFGDYVTNVGLHPVTNTIFVLTFDGLISIFDPETYNLVTPAITYPNTGNGNYIVFDTAADVFYTVGYDGASVPHYHVYDLTTYAYVRGVPVTSMAAGDEIFVCSLSPDMSKLAMINADGSSPVTAVHELAGDTEIYTYTANSGILKWVLFSPYQDVFYTTCADNTINKFVWDGSSTYSLAFTFSTASLGSPNCINLGIRGRMMVSMNDKLYYFSIGSSNLTELNMWQEVANIFVFDFSLGIDYLVVGMQTGEVSLYEFNWPPADEENKKSGLSQGALIGIIVGCLALLVLVLVLIAWKCCCKSKVGAKDEEPSASSLSKNKVLKIKPKHKQRFTVISVPQKKEDDEESQDLDYDQLMAHGTIIVIKDDVKKREFMRKLKKQDKKEKKQNKMDETRSESSSEPNWEDFVQGNIIIIRDDVHRKKRRQGDDDDLSSNPDYDQLMAEGNIIIIKDDPRKKKYVEQIEKGKEKKSDHSEELNYEQLMAEGNIIIIRDEEDKKKYVSKLKKEQEINKIKHDQLQANGTILVIKDEQKKKELINNFKKDKNKTLDKKDENALQVAENIIVIRDLYKKGEDDSDDDEEPSYEQLMAEGTVIVIKDDDVQRKFTKYVEKEKKKQGNKSKPKREQDQEESDSSEEPDLGTLMVQGHVIVISDREDKRMYTEFMKKQLLKDNKSDLSSVVDYDQLMRDANAIAIKDERPEKKRMNNTSYETKLREKRSDADEDGVEFERMMAEGNVIVIGESSEHKNVMAQQSTIRLQ